MKLDAPTLIRAPKAGLSRRGAPPGWTSYLGTVAAAAGLLVATLLAYRLIGLVLVAGMPLQRAIGFLLNGLAGDVALAVAFGSLAGGMAFGRTGLRASLLLMPLLCTSAAVLVVSGFVAPITEWALDIYILGQDPTLAYPLGQHTPWTLVQMATAISAGALPVPNPSMASSAMAKMFLFEASLPFSLALLTGINSGAGLLVGTARGALSTIRGCWFVCLLTSASFLAGTRLALVLSASDAVPATTIIALPLIVPASVIFTLLLTSSRTMGAE